MSVPHSPARVRVNRKAAQRVASGHPWIFASDVTDPGGASPGAVVAVFDPQNRPLGAAHYSSTSQISLRLLDRSVIPIDAAFWRARLRAAASHRAKVVQNTDCYRLVHAEGDLLPGLIIDRYGNDFVIQTLDQGMDKAKDEIVAAVAELFEPTAIIERNDATVREREGLPLQKGVLFGEVTKRTSVRMNGLAFAADLLDGQKTGVYLDQRENYLAAARYTHGAALDCFTSTGGFALHIASRAESVEAIDSSGLAIAAATANAEANGIGNIRFKEANVFDFLSNARSGGRRFDTIVLDPPAFAKSRSALDGAVRGYKEINLRALQLLGPGGILVTCSCSHHMSEAMLAEAVADAALDAGKNLRVLERRYQAQDHPILLTVPETLYLKCLIVEVL